MSQTLIPKGILSVLQHLPSPDKIQPLLAPAAPRLWQIWFEKAGNKKWEPLWFLTPPRGEKTGRHFARFDPRRGVNGLQRSIDSRPPSVHTSHGCDRSICQSMCELSPWLEASHHWLYFERPVFTGNVAILAKCVVDRTLQYFRFLLHKTRFHATFVWAAQENHPVSADARLTIHYMILTFPDLIWTSSVSPFQSWLLD